MRRFESREDWLAFVGPFSVAFDPLGGDKCPYLRLLHLSSLYVVEAIRDATRNEGAERHALNLLRDKNWRAQLVGAVATYYFRSASTIEQTWRALDAGSWVSPQLAAVLSLIDDRFIVRSVDRLTDLCHVRQYPEYWIDSPIERHVAQGPGGLHYRACKTAAAVWAILRENAPHSQKLAEIDANAEIQQLVASDRDGAAKIATNWRKRLQELAG
jgi:hypothetical protein